MSKLFSLLPIFLLLFGDMHSSHAAERWIHPKCSPMPTQKMGPFVHLGDGSILAVDGDATCVSKDGGKTWSEPRPLFREGQKLKVSNERALLRTSKGALVLVFMNLADRAWKWDDAKNRPAIDCYLHVWAARSLDDGKTWKVQQIQKGYCGAVRDLIETREGNLVVPLQRLLPDEARHATMPYVSTDGGETWKETTLLDGGGRGHHDGSIEATVEQLEDGRLWLLLRTSRDAFWEAFSSDGGLTWKDFRKSTVGASSAPAMLERLESGRLALVWNQLYPEGKTSYLRRAASWSAVPACYHREELSIAFSDNEGKSWSKPVVLARQPGAWLSYPYVFEATPGQLWITTMQGGLRIIAHEKDFLVKADAPRKASPGPQPPENCGPVSLGANVVVLPDGGWEAYRTRKLDTSYEMTVIRSRDDGRTWSDPKRLRDLPGEPWGGVIALLDRRGEVQLFCPRLRIEGKGRRIAIDRCIDIWHLRSTDGRTRLTEPARIFEGYVGAAMGAVQLSSGRIVLPFARWVPGRASAPPTGSNVTTTLYSDDDGKSWTLAKAELTAPCHASFNGANYGAIEPTMIELEDGRAWMLLRTQTGYLYEAFSKDGAEWSKPKPSRFHSSTSPASLARLPDGRIVLVWNNSDMPPRVGGQGVYGGRDALHAAISADEGKTWRGYREVYLDPRRNDTPPRSGDRGTAYPHTVVTRSGKIGLISGQGGGRRLLLLVDPQWLLLTEHQDDFRDGLEHWTVFTTFGPARGYWRDRTQGARLIPHPEKKDARVLHLRHPEGKPADGAVWNFPHGSKGTLTLRLALREGFQGGSISLTDYHLEPTDPRGEKLSLFSLDLPASGKLSEGLTLKPGQWYELGLSWDLARKECILSHQGKQVQKLSLQERPTTGISYLRLHSTAPQTDEAGFLIESVKTSVIPPG